MPEKKDPQDILQSIDFNAIGRQVAKVLVDWFSNPELFRLLSTLHGSEKQPKPNDVKPKAVCSEEGCEEPVRAKGLCAKHYQRQRYAKKQAESPRTSGRGFGECSHEGCDRTVHARGMCGAHFMEWVRAKRKSEESESELD